MALELSVPRLDSVRNAIISALAEIDDVEAALQAADEAGKGEDSGVSASSESAIEAPEQPSEAPALLSTEWLEHAVDQRCGPGVCLELRSIVEPWLQRGATRRGTVESAEPPFLDALAVVKNHLTWRRECEEYTTQLLEAGVDIDQEDYAPRRLQSAQAAASAVAVGRGIGG